MVENLIFGGSVKKTPSRQADHAQNVWDVA